MAKLFAVAFEAAASWPIALVLYTEQDLQIEAGRVAALRNSKKNAERVRLFIREAEPFEKLEIYGDFIVICVSLEYEGEPRIRFNNLSDKMAKRFIYGE